MYTALMRRLQIYIDDQMDDFLATRALHEGTSKAALIRSAVREHYAEHYAENTADDPLDEWVGAVDAESGDVDDVVYGE